MAQNFTLTQGALLVAGNVSSSDLQVLPGSLLEIVVGTLGGSQSLPTPSRTYCGVVRNASGKVLAGLLTQLWFVAQVWGRR